MRDIRAGRFTPTTFATDITRSRFVFVQVDPVIGRPFPMELVRHFDRRYERLFGYGSLARPAVRSPAWWAENFRNSLGAMRHGVSDGTWLFEHGQVVAHHAGPSPLISEDQFVAYFDEIVRRRMGEPAYGSGSERQDRPRQDAPRGEAPRAPEPVDPEPFAVLGIPATASDDEVQKAWKEQMKLNHPDRVAHLSPALQKFALAQTLEVQKAYEAITRMRRK